MHVHARVAHANVSSIQNMMKMQQRFVSLPSNYCSLLSDVCKEGNLFGNEGKTSPNET
jgi:hypothetical protein